jgi:hypothetical protein
MSDIDPNDVIWIDLCESRGLSDKPFYTVSEANQLLERARSTIHRWIKAGHLDSRPWGPGGIVITRRSIQALLGLDSTGSTTSTGSTSTGSTGSTGSTSGKVQ